MIKQFSGKYAFLNNAFIHPIKWNGKIYDSAEHIYQSLKTLDGSEREKIRQSSSPKKAIKIGHQIKLRPLWEEIKFAAMYAVLADKFEDPQLKGKLLDTGKEELVYGNDYGDVYWGVCENVGINCLGRILMDIRTNAETKELNEYIECMDEDES